MTDDRKVITTGKRSLTIQHGTGAANVIDQVLSDTLALARSSEVSKEVFTEINGIMFDQLSVNQLDIWAKTIIIDENEDFLAEIDLSELVELMNSAFFKIEEDKDVFGDVDWVCDGKIVAAYFPEATQWRKGELDVSKLPGLIKLDASNMQLTELDVSNNSKLTQLWVSHNRLTELDVSNNPELTKINVSGNELTELDVSNNPVLTDLDVDHNNLSQLDVSHNPELNSLGVPANQLTELDVSNNPVLTELWVFENQLTELDLSNNPELTHTGVSGDQLTKLRLSNEIDLENKANRFNIEIPSDLKFDKVKGYYTNE